MSYTLLLGSDLSQANMKFKKCFTVKFAVRRNLLRTFFNTVKAPKYRNFNFLLHFKYAYDEFGEPENKIPFETSKTLSHGIALFLFTMHKFLSSRHSILPSLLNDKRMTKMDKRVLFSYLVG